MESHPASGMEYYEYPDYIDIMELYVETLTGTAFELHVSPFETVISVKAKIQRVEGIPIGQQHLIYRSIELEDDYCLQDYGIPPGASLKLVLAMRGGPINTRRIPMEDPAIREMADYMEANKDEIWEKLPGNRQVTLLVFREGDQLNFFRVVDRGDGTLTPLSESLSGASIHGGEYEEDVDNSKELTTEQSQENDTIMSKMKLLRTKMENLSVVKKQSKIPRPPSRPRSSSKRNASSVRNIRGTKNSLSKVEPLPPVQGRLEQAQPLDTSGTAARTERSISRGRSLLSSSLEELAPNQGHEGASSFPVPTISEQRELSTENRTTIPSQRTDSSKSAFRPRVLSGKRMTPISVVSSSAGHRLHTVDKSRSPVLNGLAQQNLGNRRLHQVGKSRSPVPNTMAQQNLEKLSAKFHMNHNPNRTTTSLPKFAQGRKMEDFRPGAMSSQRVSSSRQFNNPDSSPSTERVTLGPADARAVTDLVNQANREGKINNIVCQRDPLTRSRISPSPALLSRVFNGSASVSKSQEKLTSPEAARQALISAHSIRGKLSGGRESRIVASPVCRLPPVVNTSVPTKKKSSKRCYLCNKKTGLATSYQCRCGHNYCASHRYAEAHSCGFDYKTEGRKLLEQSNPLVSAPKLPKI